VQEVARRASVSRPAVWRWQARYAEQGVEGLLRDRTRKPGRAPLSAKVVAKVMDLTCSEPPGHATHWTGRAMAKAVGVSLRAVQRLWQAHRLQPHRIRTFKRSNDPEFAEKVEDIVGLYMDPPKHTVVVSIDEKSQIQALDRTQPGLPLKPGKCGTMTHGYKRNGTTTLFAALNILDGTVIGRCMRRHRHQEFIRFLNAVERAVPAGKVVHAIVDNYAAHKQPNVLKWLADHPRWTSISPRPRPRGSTPSRASSRPSHAARSDAEPSIPSTICRTRSHATLTPTTAIVGPSHGPPPPKRSSKNSLRSLYLLSESVH
jgi:transposase